MKNEVLPFSIDEDVHLSRHLRGNVVRYTGPMPETRWEKTWKYLMYGMVAAGVTFAAAFVATPAHSREQGTMNHEARVIQVSPSITFYGSQKDYVKAQSQIMRDNNRHMNAMELEDAKALHRRQLEADKAYYKKLEFQRKKRGF